MRVKHKEIYNEDNVIFFENLLSVAQDVAAGIPIVRACKKHSVNYLAYLHLIGRERLGYQSRLDNIEEFGGTNPRGHMRSGLLSWQENLWLSIFGETDAAMIPPDIDEMIENALHHPKITARERQILNMRYKEGMTLEECGKALGYEREWMRQIEAKALRKLRNPAISRGLRYGKAVRDRFEELRAVRTQGVISEEVQQVERNIREAIEDNDKIKLLECQKLIYDALGVEEKPAKAFLNRDITELCLSVRTYNCLQKAGVRTFGDLSEKNFEDLWNIRGFGQKCMSEIVHKMQDEKIPSKLLEELRQ